MYYSSGCKEAQKNCIKTVVMYAHLSVATPKKA